MSHDAWEAMLRESFLTNMLSKDHKEVSQVSQEITRRVLESTDFFEEQESSLIHKIILGKSKSILEEELLRDPSAVDSVDFGRRTALYWAAGRGDQDSIRILMRYGANPNAMSSSGANPVYVATNAGREGCLGLLLEAGAETDPVLPGGITRSTPLTRAAMYSANPITMKLLLEFGAKIEACNPEGLTALHQVARCNTASHAAVLLDRHADVNARSKDGQTPLILATIYNNHSVLRLLLERSEHHPESPCLEGPNLLKVVAEFADLETMIILISADLSRVCIGKCLAVDDSTIEVMRQGFKCPEEVKSAFRVLVQNFRAQRVKGEDRDATIQRESLLSFALHCLVLRWYGMH